MARSSRQQRVQFFASPPVQFRASLDTALATLLTTAKLNNVDPHAWLKLTLERIAGGWSNRELDALMPWNYHKA